MPEIVVTGKQLAKALAFPEKVELTREQAQEIISAALETWKNGKPKPEEVAEFLRLPHVIVATQKVSAGIVEAVVRVARTEERPTRKLSLTRSQVIEAVSQLPWRDKVLLKNKLEAEFRTRYRELFEDLQDLAIIAERKGEPAQPFEVVKERLEGKWQNTASK